MKWWQASRRLDVFVGDLSVSGATPPTPILMCDPNIFKTQPFLGSGPRTDPKNEPEPRIYTILTHTQWRSGRSLVWITGEFIPWQTWWQWRWRPWNRRTSFLREHQLAKSCGEKGRTLGSSIPHPTYVHSYSYLFQTPHLRPNVRLFPSPSIPISHCSNIHLFSSPTVPKSVCCHIRLNEVWWSTVWPDCKDGMTRL